MIEDKALAFLKEQHPDITFRCLAPGESSLHSGIISLFVGEYGDKILKVTDGKERKDFGILLWNVKGGIQDLNAKILKIKNSFQELDDDFPITVHLKGNVGLEVCDCYVGMFSGK